mgnify:CR=1 FL=1
MKIASTITVTTAEVVVSIKDESGSIIMEKTLSLAIPERISDQMTDIIIVSNVEKHEYRLANPVKRLVASDGTLILTDYIDQKF